MAGMTQADLDLVMKAVDARNADLERRVHRSFAHATKNVVGRIPPQVRADLYATVVESDAQTVRVQLDVDGTTIDAYPLGQFYTVGDRVLVMFTPPSLAVVLGVLPPSITDPLQIAAELIRDVMGLALVGGPGITVTPDDPGDTILIEADDTPIGESFLDLGMVSGAVEIDWSAAVVQRLTMTAPVSLSVVNMIPGRACGLTLYLVQDGVGGRTATWPAATRWPAATPPTLTATPLATDIVVLESTDAAILYANLAGKGYA